MFYVKPLIIHLQTLLIPQMVRKSKSVHLMAFDIDLYERHNHNQLSLLRHTSS